MKSSNILLSHKWLIAFSLLVLGIAAMAQRAIAQQGGWQVIHADYGHKNQRNDVTDLVQDLIARGGVNGRVAVNNQTMGGDPAVGTDKSLHIVVTNQRGEQREFNFEEGSSFEASMFAVPARDTDDRNGYRGPRGDRDWDDLWIVRGYYGVQGKMVNVTDLLQSMVRDRALNVVVTNSVMGGDPAIGADKMLIVIYRYQGKEQATVVREGNTLSLP